MKPKNNSNHDSPKKVFDVSRPGKTLAETTSRPVIVGHKPQVQDPMMMHPEEQRSLMDAKRKVVVAPSAPVVAANDQLPASPMSDPVEATEAPTSEPKAVGIAEDSPKDSEQVEPADAVVSASSAPTVPDSEALQMEPSLVDASEKSPTGQPEPEPVTLAAAESSETPAASTAPEISSLTPKSQSTSAAAPEDSVAAILSQGAKEAEMSHTTPTIISDQLLPDISDAHVYPPTTMIVSHHDKSARIGKIALWAFIVLILAAVIIDILLDAGFFVLSVPHTDFF